MPGVLELVVRRPAIVDHGAAVVKSQDVLGDGTAARGVDDVSRGLLFDQRVQPGWVSAYSPAGLIRHNPVGLSHGLADGLVNRLAARGGAEDGVDAAAATEADTKQALQAARDFSVRHAALLVEFDDRGLGVWSQLSRGGTKSIGGL